jgi:hypothetical protein
MSGDRFAHNAAHVKVFNGDHAVGLGQLRRRWISAKSIATRARPWLSRILRRCSRRARARAACALTPSRAPISVYIRLSVAMAEAAC